MTRTDPVLDEMLSAASFTQDPYPAHARLRSSRGLYWCAPWAAWVASRYTDVAEALRRDGLDLSAVGQTSAALAHLSGSEREMLGPIERLFSAGLLWSDPPDHERIRAVVNKVLNPRDLERMGPRAAGIIDEAVAALPADEPFDVVARLASPIPVAVLAELLGIPAVDVASVRTWADTLADFMGTPHPSAAQADAAQGVVLEARACVDRLVVRDASGLRQDGVIQRLAALRAGNADVSDDEFHATIIVLLVGGHRTTAAGIASAILALARRADERARLSADGGQIPTAVEELLRFESPHQRTVRIVRRDMELAGTMLRKGDVVVLLNGAANRDGDHFSQPDELRIDRRPNRHLAFSSGIHFCIGAPLARIELAETIRSFLVRYPDFELAAEPAWLENHTLRSLVSLWIAPRSTAA